jgi:hypothetical protein
MFGVGQYQISQASWPEPFSAWPTNILHPTSETEFQILHDVGNAMVAPMPETGYVKRFACQPNFTIEHDTD